MSKEFQEENNKTRLKIIDSAFSEREKEEQRLLKEQMKQEACVLSSDSDFIFTTKNGTPLQPTAINSFLRNNKQEMGIAKTKRISTHIFRHTHISKLAELEMPLYVIQKRVGHSSSKITEKIYLHITEKMKEKTRNLLEFL